MTHDAISSRPQEQPPHRRRSISAFGCACLATWLWTVGFCAPLSADQAIPSPAKEPVDFVDDVMPILARRCASCHAQGKQEGGLDLATRAGMLAGGDSGDAVVLGKSGDSLLVQLAAGLEEGRLMPANGQRLSPREIGVLRRWIDDQAPWPADRVINAAALTETIHPRRHELPTVDGVENPIDRLLHDYLANHDAKLGPVIDDAAFQRRVALDLVGLLPTTAEQAAFLADSSPDKRTALVERLLDERTGYALHWMTFWNDALRNAYRGTGFIDNGRSQITGWLFAALYDNMPYDQFVRELVAPTSGAEGFTKGIRWRGVVNASQRPEMQAAQTLSQVFLGTNLKCASCHDSFVNQWTLADSYALASVFADSPLEIHHCDKPAGEFAEPAFLFSALGSIDVNAPRDDRLRQLADVVTAESNGRLARTIVNRLWAEFFGRGIVADLDDMDQEPFDAELLDWLAADLQDHGYDLKRTIAMICTSRAYQSAAVAAPGAEDDDGVFRGPRVRRMTAEQFSDAVSQLINAWQPVTKSMLKRDGRAQGGQLAAVVAALAERGAVELPDSAAAKEEGDDEQESGPTAEDVPVDLRRAVMADANPLLVAMGRPNREQVVTSRDSAATTLEALELTNGATLDDLLHAGAESWLERCDAAPELTTAIYATALGRAPTDDERLAAEQLIGSPAAVEGVQDLLWAVVMLPEFQLID